jgi:hypothetical protein
MTARSKCVSLATGFISADLAGVRIVQANSLLRSSRELATRARPAMRAAQARSAAGRAAVPLLTRSLEAYSATCELCFYER